MAERVDEGGLGERSEEQRREHAQLLAKMAELDAEWEQLNKNSIDRFLEPVALDDDHRTGYRVMYGAGFGDDLTQREHANRLLARSQALSQRPVHIRDLSAEEVLLAKDAANARKIKTIDGNLLRTENEDYFYTTVFEPPAAAAGKCSRCGHSTHLSPQVRTWSLEKTANQWQGVLYFDLVVKCALCDGRTRNTKAPTFGYANPWLIAHTVAQCFCYDKDEPLTNHVLLEQGIEVRPGTMSLWCRDVAEVAKPVYELMYQQTKAAAVLGIIQAPVRLLPVEPQRDARVWMMADPKPGSPKVFDFTLGKSTRPPAKMLGGYKGKVLALSFRGQDGVELEKGMPRMMALNEVIAVLEQSQATHPDIYDESVRLTESLNALEKDVDGEDLLAVRRGPGLERLAALKALLLNWRAKLAATHPHAVEIDDLLRQWEWVEAFMTDESLVAPGALAVAHFMQNPALYSGSSFVGTQRGCETAAVLATLVTTCRVLGVGPDAYFAHMLLAPEDVAAHPERWLPEAFVERLMSVAEAGKVPEV